MQLQHLPRAVVAADGATGFNWHAGMATDAQLQSNDRMSPTKRCFKVPVLLADITRRGGTARFEFTGRLIRLEQRRQFLDVQQDPVGGIFGRRAMPRGIARPAQAQRGRLGRRLARQRCDDRAALDVVLINVVLQRVPRQADPSLFNLYELV